MPEKIRQLARRILKDPVEINIAISKPPEKIVQKAFVVYDTQKLPLLQHVLATTPYKSALVFCSSKQNVKLLTREMQRARYKDGRNSQRPGTVAARRRAEWLYQQTHSHTHCHRHPQPRY